MFGLKKPPATQPSPLKRKFIPKRSPVLDYLKNSAWPTVGENFGSIPQNPKVKANNKVLEYLKNSDITNLESGENF